MSANFLTKEWFEKLKKELLILKNEKLPGVLVRLKDAIWQWDISENSEYESALAEKDLVEARISELSTFLDNVEIIEEGEVKTSDDVRYWSKVVLEDDKWKVFEFTIVWSWEVDILNGQISFESPVWTAIKWKRAGDMVKVRSPRRRYEMKILSIN